MLNTRKIVQSICEIVGKRHGIEADELRQDCATPEARWARKITLYLVRKETVGPLFVTAHWFRGENASTVLTACREVQEVVEKDDAIRKEVEELLSLCKESLKPRPAKLLSALHQKNARRVFKNRERGQTKKTTQREKAVAEPESAVVEMPTQEAVEVPPELSETSPENMNAPETFSNSQASSTAPRESLPKTHRGETASALAEARWWVSRCRQGATSYERGISVKGFLELAKEARKDIGYDPRLRVGEYADDHGLQRSLDKRDRIMSNFNTLVEQELVGLDGTNVLC